MFCSASFNRKTLEVSCVLSNKGTVDSVVGYLHYVMHLLNLIMKSVWEHGKYCIIKRLKTSTRIKSQIWNKCNKERTYVSVDGAKTEIHKNGNSFGRLGIFGCLGCYCWFNF